MQPAAPMRRRWRHLIGIAAGVAAICASAGSAFAEGGGIAPPDPAQPRDFACIERCPPGDHTATVGSKLQVTGRALGSVSEVIFTSAGGRVATPATSVSDRAVQAKVPANAADGPLRVSAAGASVPVDDWKLDVVPESALPAVGSFKLASAVAKPKRAYFDGARAPKVSYMFRGSSATDVRIEVVNVQTKEVVDSFVEPAAQPNAANTASWDGTTADGATAPNGDYRFRIGSDAGVGAEATEDSSFAFHKFRFPIAARHGYGDGYGAGRNHEGQDVFAKCGSLLFAARGGRVQVNDAHSAAGNYLVIDGKGTGMDFTYAHMLRTSPLRKGARVHTGQQIGQVGQSGNAEGCHLHFELWSAPGYYEGGAAMASVGTFLKTIDRWS